MKKGFTLIELLAVILILGIIALIAIPIVSKIIKDSKKSSFESATNNIVGVIEDTCQEQVLKGEPITSTYTFADGEVSPSLNLKGKLPTNGTATVDSSCKVTLGVTNGSFVATKTSSADRVTLVAGDKVTKVYSNGTAVYFNPITGAKCTAGQAVSTTGTKTGCMKWYAFNDDGASTDTIDLILDHNTTAIVAWNSTGSNVSGPTNVMTQLASDTSSWAGVPTRSDNYSVSNGTATYTINYSTYKAKLITAAELATIIGATYFNEPTADPNSWFNLYDYLFDYTTDCTSYGCNIDDASASTWGYWTATAVSGRAYSAWLVHGDGGLRDYIVDIAEAYGVHPVITVSKSIFE